MTLGGWFREYVYIPLGGNRKGVARQMINILLVWMLTGIWHGAGFNFLLWGLWYAVFLILEKLFLLKVFRKLPNFFGLIYTCVVVLVGWVFFTVESAEGIRGYLQAMFGMNGVGLFDARGLFLGREYLILFIIAFVAATPLVRHMAVNLEYSRRTWGTALYRLGEKVIPPVLLLLSIAYVVDASYNPFLYFRF
jgi:alginate O-acetyltransferase complex protein AlgI